MCHEADSAPPIPRIYGAAVSHEDLVLEAADGNQFAAFAASPEEPSGVGIVVLPDIRGLYHFYEELALRFAERGHTAVAIDYFGRTAGASKRTDDFDWKPHVEQTTDDGVQADTRAAVEQLRRSGCTAVFTVGFCFGGRKSWLATAGGHGLAGAIGFYGRPGAGPDGSAGPTQLAGELAAPILALMGGRRPGHPGRGRRGIRSRPGRRGRRARGRRLPRCAAQLLRPQVRGVRGRVGGRVGPRARVRRALPLGPLGQASAAVRSPSSGPIGWSAATTFAMCSSSSRPRSSAPA